MFSVKLYNFFNKNNNFLVIQFKTRDRSKKKILINDNHNKKIINFINTAFRLDKIKYFCSIYFKFRQQLFSYF